MERYVGKITLLKVSAPLPGVRIATCVHGPHTCGAMESMMWPWPSNPVARYCFCGAAQMICASALGVPALRCVAAAALPVHAPGCAPSHTAAAYPGHV